MTREVNNGGVDRVYPTPEEAALTEWASYPEARARVIEVEHLGDDVVVVVTDTVPSHPMNNRCRRTARGWVYEGDWN